MAREVGRCGGRVRVGLRLVLQRVGPGLAWPAERCEPARSHKDRSDQVQGRERHRLATTAMANLLQGCNSLGAVNSELSHSENTSGGGGRASIRNAYLLVLFVLSARRSGIAIGRDEHFLSIFRGGESTVKPYPQRLFMFVLSCTQHRYYTGLTPSGRRSCRKAYGFMDSQKKKPHSSEPTSSRSAVTTRVGFDWFLSGIAAEHWLDPVGA